MCACLEVFSATGTFQFQKGFIGGCKKIFDTAKLMPRFECGSFRVAVRQWETRWVRFFRILDRRILQKLIGLV